MRQASNAALGSIQPQNARLKQIHTSFHWLVSETSDDLLSLHKSMVWMGGASSLEVNPTSQPDMGHSQSIDGPKSSLEWGSAPQQSSQPEDVPVPDTPTEECQGSDDNAEEEDEDQTEKAAHKEHNKRKRESGDTGGVLATTASLALQALQAAACSGASAKPFPTERAGLQRAIFAALCHKTSGIPLLGPSQMLDFAKLTGFDGDESAWAEDFKLLSSVHGDGPGGCLTEAGFKAMLNDKSEDGFHCTNKELTLVLDKLVQRYALRAAAGLDDCSTTDCEESDEDKTIHHVSLVDAADLLKKAWDEQEEGQGTEDEEEDSQGEPAEEHHDSGAENREARNTRNTSKLLGRAPTSSNRYQELDIPVPAASSRATPGEGHRKGTIDRQHGTVATQDILSVVRDLLVDLGSEDSLNDKGMIPRVSRKIANEYLPETSITEILRIMVDVFANAAGSRLHRIAIVYVFHELLMQATGSARRLVAKQGAKIFLEPVAPYVTQHKPGEVTHLFKLLSLWERNGTYKVEYVKYLRKIWKPRPGNRDRHREREQRHTTEYDNRTSEPRERSRSLSV